MSSYAVYSIPVTSLPPILSALTCPKKILCPPISVLLLCFCMLSAMNDAAMGPFTNMFFGFLSFTCEFLLFFGQVELAFHNGCFARCCFQCKIPPRRL